MIAAVVLAAGRSSRFGGNKLLAPLGGQAVIRWSVEALASEADEVVVVVPPGDTAIRSALQGLEVRFAENARREEGMSSSLAEGVSALPVDCQALLVALGDQPGIRGAVAGALIGRWRERGAMAVVPVYADGRGHPVLFDRRCFPRLVALRGDVGARAVLASLGDDVAVVTVPHPQPSGVDTAEVLERLERSQRPGT